MFAILALLLSATATERAFADTYYLETVAFTENENFAGGDDFGDYTINITNNVIFQPNPMCGSIANPAACFETYYVGNPNPVYTTTAPALRVDHDPIAGDQLCVVPSDFDVLRELCTNGHLLFAGFYIPPGGGMELRGIFDGTDPALDFLGDNTIDGGFMTANGNAYFIDGLRDTLVAAIDLDTIPVPEPGGLALLGTGVIAAMGVVRRRARRQI